MISMQMRVEEEKGSLEGSENQEESNYDQQLILADHGSNLNILTESTSNQLFYLQLGENGVTSQPL